MSYGCPVEGIVEVEDSEIVVATVTHLVEAVTAIEVGATECRKFVTRARIGG